MLSYEIRAEIQLHQENSRPETPGDHPGVLSNASQPDVSQATAPRSNCSRRGSPPPPAPATRLGEEHESRHVVLVVGVLEDADGEAEDRAGVPAAADDHGPVGGTGAWVRLRAGALGRGGAPPGGVGPPPGAAQAHLPSRATPSWCLSGLVSSSQPCSF